MKLKKALYNTGTYEILDETVKFKEDDPVFIDDEGLATNVMAEGLKFAGFANTKASFELGHKRVVADQDAGWGFDFHGAVEEFAGDDAFMGADGEIFSADTALRVKVGKINEIENGVVWVKLELFNAVLAAETP